MHPIPSRSASIPLPILFPIATRSFQVGFHLVHISFPFGSYFVCTDVRPIKVCSYLVSTLFLLGLHISWWSYAPPHPFCTQSPQDRFNVVSIWFPFRSYFVCTNYGRIICCSYFVSTSFPLGLHTFGWPLTVRFRSHAPLPSPHPVTPRSFQFCFHLVPI